jgi:uncharacterized integral membrane protein (TIGR00698 family)
VSPPSKPAARTLAPGLALAVALALVAYGISHVEPRISALVAALLLGMLVSNVISGRRAELTPGARFAARRVLRFGIALLGLRISLELIGNVGWRGVLVAVAAVGFTLPFTVWLGRRLGVSPALSLLIGAGCGICGAAAVVAMEPIAEAKDEEAGFALATVTALGTIAMLALPVLGTSALGLSDDDFGLWAGGSVHEVAQVVGAAGGVSAAALAVATIVKLTRVVLLVPVMVVTAVIKGRAGGKRGNPVPLFVACFLVAVLIRSTGWLSASFVGHATDFDTALLACAMAGLGLTIDVAQLRRLGGRPLVLGATSSALLAVVILGLVTVTS